MTFTFVHVVKRRIAIAIALALTLGSSIDLSAQAQSRGAKSFLWKVQSGPRVMYLAGSVHALSADVYPLNPAFERAFAASDTLVEEISLEQSGILSLAPMLLTKAMYQDGRTFDKVVSKETADLVAAHLKSSPLSLELIRPMKPWMVMLMLSAMQIQQAGFDPSLGLDQHFFDKATKAGKTLVALETAEYQIDRFDTMPVALQEQLLRSTLDELTTQSKELGSTVAAWQRGDAAAIERGVLGSFKKYPGAYQSLIVERNNNWIPHVETCLKQNAGCFIVVGAAHLVGPDGLPNLLSKKGYKVTQQ